MTKIELKNIKYAAFASQETSCYQGTLYVNGKRFANVSNEGHGGCDSQTTSMTPIWRSFAEIY